MKTKSHLCLLIALCLGVTLSAAEDSRTWTNTRTGREIKGVYSGTAVIGGQEVVLLKRVDKTSVKVPLSDLSDEDRKFIASTKLIKAPEAQPAAAPLLPKAPEGRASKSSSERIPPAPLVPSALPAPVAVAETVPAQPEATAPAVATSLTAFEKKLAGSTGRLSANGEYTASKPESFASKPYYAVYYSAHWCPPCRAFTPKLVDYYNQTRSSATFEVIFASSDETRKDMLKYAKWGKMTWLGLDFGSSLFDEFSAEGIPYMVIFDRNGKKVWPSSPEWVHPSAGLAELQKLSR